MASRADALSALHAVQLGAEAAVCITGQQFTTLADGLVDFIAEHSTQTIEVHAVEAVVHTASAPATAESVALRFDKGLLGIEPGFGIRICSKSVFK